jgi:anti-sigma factor RsiW
MSGQVLDLTRSPHQAAFELLPWLVNGTLDDVERVQVEQHLQTCAACRRERDWLTQLAGACASGEIVVDADRALARFVERLRPDEAPGSVREGGARAKPSGLLGWLLGPRAGWLKFAAAMQLGVIVALGWALLVREPAYRTLGAVPASERANGNVIVVFDPATPEGEVRRILRDAGARVVDGPTATRGYVLDVAGTPQIRAIALRRLRAEPAVTLAEPLTSERTP